RRGILCLTLLSRDCRLAMRPPPLAQPLDVLIPLATRPKCEWGEPRAGWPWPGVTEPEGSIRRTRQGQCRGTQPIANGINNLVGGWGCRSLPDSDIVKRSSRGHHYPGIGLIHTLV